MKIDFNFYCGSFVLFFISKQNNNDIYLTDFWTHSVDSQRENDLDLILVDLWDGEFGGVVVSVVGQGTSGVCKVEYFGEFFT